MRLLTYGILSALLINGPTWAKHWHDDKDHWAKHGKHEDYDDRDFDHHAGGCRFQPVEVRVIREYYAPRYRDLPPGLQKKLYRTGHLPPGWERRIEPVPVIIEQRLVPAPVGYRRGFIDGYVVMYSPRTQVIVDIVAVFGGR
jgi:hypothetical protein